MSPATEQEPDMKTRTAPDGTTFVAIDTFSLRPGHVLAWASNDDDGPLTFEDRRLVGGVRSVSGGETLLRFRGYSKPFYATPQSDVWVTEESAEDVAFTTFTTGRSGWHVPNQTPTTTSTRRNPT
jgi:hypothetical protein